MLFVTGCLKPPVDLAGIRGLMQIFDTGFVDQRTERALPHLDRIAVVPFDGAFDSLPIFEKENHQGSALNLLLQVKLLSVGALPSCCGGPSMVGGENRRDRPRRIAVYTQREVWTNELAWPCGADGRQGR